MILSGSPLEPFFPDQGDERTPTVARDGKGSIFSLLSHLKLLVPVPRSHRAHNEPASIQLIPFTVIGILAGFGHGNPATVVFPVLISTAISTITALLVLAAFRKVFR